MFLVVLYIGIFMVYISKGYQAEDVLLGTTSVKVKGTGSANATNPNTKDWQDMMVFTSQDLVIPSVEADATFITTRLLITANQKQGTCAGNEDVQECETDDDCVENTYTPLGVGVLTGKCATDVGRCMVKGWCPLESKNYQPVQNVNTWTLFIKVNGRFQQFEYDFTNALDKNGTHLPILGYNLFSVDDILQMAGSEFDDGTKTSVRNKGGIFLFTTSVDCNLDRADATDGCPMPEYRVQRVDNVPGTINPGFNFRTVSYTVDADGTQQRTLTKHTGIRILFHLSGRGRKFNFGVLSTTVGAGMAFLAIATVICDIILENFLGEVSERYEKVKNQDLAHDGDLMGTPQSQYGDRRRTSRAKTAPTITDPHAYNAFVEERIN